MERYFLVLVQSADGCDYSIGCGTRVVPLISVTRGMAIVEAEEYVANEDHGFLSSKDHELASALVASVEHYVPIDALTLNARSERRRREEAASEAKERAELERLQRKYGAR